MRVLRNRRSLRARFGAIVVFAVALPACRPQAPAAAKTPPAKVGSIAHEDQLNTLTLTPEAERRLGIETAPIEIQPVERVRSYGAEVALPIGATIVVSAPVGGTLQAPSAAGAPQVGEMVERKQPVFLLLPLLSPERSVLTPAERIRFAEARAAVAQQQIDAAGQVAQAEVQLEAAQIALDRAERLLREKAGTARAVDDAQAQVNLAEQSLEVATRRKKLVDDIRLDEDPGTLAPLVLEAPQSGVMRAQHATVGEVVAAAAPLFEVLDYRVVWIKVSVYAGESAEIAADKPAVVTSLADGAVDKGLSARPIAAPPTATPLSSTVDHYYELANEDGRFRPGERVTARVALTGAGRRSVVRWSAVIHDSQGGSWVYVRVAPQTYARARVDVAYVTDGIAVIERGPEVGAQVVTQGAVELFGTEFGFDH